MVCRTWVALCVAADAGQTHILGLLHRAQFTTSPTLLCQVLQSVAHGKAVCICTEWAGAPGGTPPLVKTCVRGVIVQ